MSNGICFFRLNLFLGHSHAAVRRCSGSAGRLRIRPKPHHSHAIILTKAHFHGSDRISDIRRGVSEDDRRPGLRMTGERGRGTCYGRTGASNLADSAGRGLLGAFRTWPGVPEPARSEVEWVSHPRPWCFRGMPDYGFRPLLADDVDGYRDGFGRHTHGIVAGLEVEVGLDEVVAGGGHDLCLDYELVGVDAELVFRG